MSCHFKWKETLTTKASAVIMIDHQLLWTMDEPWLPCKWKLRNAKSSGDLLRIGPLDCSLCLLSRNLSHCIPSSPVGEQRISTDNTVMKWTSEERTKIGEDLEISLHDADRSSIGRRACQCLRARSGWVLTLTTGRARGDKPFCAVQTSTHSRSLQ